MKVRFVACAAVAASMLAITLTGSRGAWACFPFPVLSVQPRASGPAGAQVTVEGVDFGDGATEVRWNAIDGPLLGHGSAERFSASVTIPQAEAGVYSIVGLARKTDGSVGVKAVTPFEVSSGAGVPTVAGSSPASSPGLRGATSSTADLSTTAIAGLLLGGLAVSLAGGIGGAYLFTRRRRS